MANHRQSSGENSSDEGGDPRAVDESEVEPGSTDGSSSESDTTARERSDSASESRDASIDSSDRTDSSPSDESSTVSDPSGSVDELTTEELRERVEAEYDFESFGPADMDEMSAREWDSVFDPETWITGEPLLDRIEAELRSKVATRDVFAVIERVGTDDDERVVAYSDEGYAIVRPDGTVLGTGTVLRDVEPSVALCAMEEYDVPEPPEGAGLPHPDTVPEGSGDFGNRILQLVAGATLLSGLVLLSAWLLSIPGFVELGAAGAIVAALGFLFVAIGVFLFATVANARLSDRMRSAQYRDRLEAVGAGSETRPAFLPDEAFEAGGRKLEEAMERIHRDATDRADSHRD